METPRRAVSRLLGCAAVQIGPVVRPLPDQGASHEARLDEIGTSRSCLVFAVSARTIITLCFQSKSSHMSGDFLLFGSGAISSLRTPANAATHSHGRYSGRTFANSVCICAGAMMLTWP